MSLVAETATLVYGYTMADVERVARAASRRAFSTALDEIDRYECAWTAIVTLLYGERTPPSYGDLFNSARQAISRETAKHWGQHGIDKNTWQPTPRFLTYWGPSDRGSKWPTDFTDGSAERIALPQVLALLTPEEYEAIAALAVHGSWRAAEKATGMGSTFRVRVNSARDRIREAWYAPDHPPARNTEGNDDECGRGHPRSHSYLSPNGQRLCRKCLRINRQTTRQNKVRGDTSMDEAERELVAARLQELGTVAQALTPAQQEQAERDQRIRNLREQGLSLEQIGMEVGRAGTTVLRSLRRTEPVTAAG